MPNLATAVPYTMPATLPPANDAPEMDNPPADMMDSDQDAEGEEETDFYQMQMDQQLQDAVHRAYSGEVAAEENMMNNDEDRDADGEPDVEAILDGDNDETEPVGAVKLPDEAAQSSDNDEEDEDADAEADPAFENQSASDRAGSSSSSQGSNAEEEEWEGESNIHEDADLGNILRNNCM